MVDAGRRTGKTRLGCACAVQAAWPRSPYPVWWVAPSYPYTQVAWRYLREKLRGISIIRESEKILEFPGGNFIQVKSADNPDSLRSEGLTRVIVDEAAYVLKEAWHECLRPALMDCRGDALFLSTPHGMNWFWEVFQLEHSDPDWKSWQLPTSANPFIDPSEIDNLRRTMAERVFQQEVMAQFIEMEGVLFRRVRESATAQEQKVPILKHQYVFGIDLGRRVDFTAIIIYDCTLNAAVYHERFQGEWSHQTQRIHDLAKLFKPVGILVDQTGVGDPVVEELQHDIGDVYPVEGFIFNNASKHQVIEGLALAFERGDIKIVNNEILIQQLLSFQVEKLPSGLLRYGAPEGLHDDSIIALTLAYHHGYNTQEDYEAVLA